VSARGRTRGRGTPPCREAQCFCRLRCPESPPTILLFGTTQRAALRWGSVCVCVYVCVCAAIVRPPNPPKCCSHFSIVTVGVTTWTSPKVSLLTPAKSRRPTEIHRRLPELKRANGSLLADRSLLLYWLTGGPTAVYEPAALAERRQSRRHAGGKINWAHRGKDGAKEAGECAPALACACGCGCGCTCARIRM